MIDYLAINKLYQDKEGKKLVDDFYQLLLLYCNDGKLDNIDKCLNELNKLAKNKKMRLVYYDNQCLKEDISQYIMKEYLNIRKKS